MPLTLLLVREHLLDEMKQIMNKFDEWDPDTKALQDIKYRLSAIKSSVLSGKPMMAMPMPIGMGNSVPPGAPAA